MEKNKFKILYLILVVFISFLAFSPEVLAAAEGFNVCQKSGIVKSFQIVGYCLFILKILVPILLIVMGSIDLGKAFISSDDKAIKTAINILIKRAIAGVVIFFIPTLISFVVSLINSADELNDFSCLNTCIEKPSDCVIPSGGVFGS